MLLLRHFRKIHLKINRYSFSKKSEFEVFNESFLSGNNGVYIEQMFEKWAEDKQSVPSSWDIYFTNVVKGYDADEAFQIPPSLSPSSSIGSQTMTIEKKRTDGVTKYLNEILRLELMIQGFQFRGHEMADLDPLSKK